MYRILARRFSCGKIDNEVRIKIGRALRAIPEEYSRFFDNSNDNTDCKIDWDDNLKLFLHLEPENPILLSEGSRNVSEFLKRFRFLMKWGHFYWRLSDLAALKMSVTKIVDSGHDFDSDNGNENAHDIASDTASDIMKDLVVKVYWKLEILKQGENLIYIDGRETKMNLKSLLHVQFNRYFNPHNITTTTTCKQTQTTIYSGLSRHVFSSRTGKCKEWHVERVEPKISGSYLINWRRSPTSPIILD